ncbi:MAG: RNA methyltransferase [Actinobacteria bacterium]|nr:RNA methyltransferase [Actinomycetota bacterium]
MIESLHSPHIARVKALLGSRGKKERRETGQFIAEGLQFLREASAGDANPSIETLYLTTSGRLKAVAAGIEINHLDTVDVSDAVMVAMGETVTPQGILAVCRTPYLRADDLVIADGSRYIFLYEIQDPGNAGTIIRTADATGFSGVITSENSVDIYAPKVVRASAGSLWHLPIFEKMDLETIIDLWPNDQIFALSADGEKSLLDLSLQGPSLWIFGNEARGLDALEISARISRVHIPMAGNAESLNLAAAAAIVMFRVTSASA